MAKVRPPSDGERRAVSGSTAQYALTAGTTIAAVTAYGAAGAAGTRVGGYQSLAMPDHGVGASEGLYNSPWQTTDAENDVYVALALPGQRPDRATYLAGGDISGAVRAGGDIGPVVAVGKLSGAVTSTGGSVGYLRAVTPSYPSAFGFWGGVWAYGAISGPIRSAAGSMAVRTWDRVEESATLTAAGSLEVYAYAAVAGDLKSAAESVTAGSWEDVVGGVEAYKLADVRAFHNVGLTLPAGDGAGADPVAGAAGGKTIKSVTGAVRVWAGGVVSSIVEAVEYAAVFASQTVKRSAKISSTKSDAWVQVSLFDIFSEEVEAKDSVKLAAGRDIGKDGELMYVTSSGDSVVMDAGRAIIGVQGSADKNLWASARTGDLGGGYATASGWIYLWAKGDIGGTATANDTLEAIAGANITASLASTTDGVQAFATKDLSGPVTGLYWVNAKAGGNVSGAIKCGDADADVWGSVTVDAGADVSGKVKSTGYAKIRAGGSATGGAEGTFGWLDVVADVAIQGDYVAGDEATLQTGGFTAAGVTAGRDIVVNATGDVRKSGGGFTSTGGSVTVQTAGTEFQDVTATGDIRIQAVTAVSGATVTSSTADTWVVANGPVSGSFTGKYVADVRTTVFGAEVTGTVRTTAPATDPGSPWSKRNVGINEQLAVLTAQGNGNTAEAQKLRTEQQLLGVQPPPVSPAAVSGSTPPADLEPSKLELDENNIPADRIRDMLTDPIFMVNNTWPAYEYPAGKNITLPIDPVFGLLVRTYSTAGYVILTDVTGKNGHLWVLEPFTRQEIPGHWEYYGGYNVGGRYWVDTKFIDSSLLGNPNARQLANFYKAVRRVDTPLGTISAEEYYARHRTPGAADRAVEAVVRSIWSNAQEFNATVMDIGVSMVPLLGTANEIAKNGFTWDAALSFGTDVTTVLGVGLVLKAKVVATSAAKTAKAAQAACKTTRIITATNVVVDGAAGVTRAVEGLQALGGDNPGKAWGSFGEAALRLFGLSVSAIKFLRTKCWVAGTPVHTAEGLTAVEAVKPGDRVWAYDRSTRRWELRPVEFVFKFATEELATARLGDGTELTGTPGHPVWVVEGADLANRPAGDHGHDEPAGPTPGRWVRLAGVRVGDVLLTRSGPARVESVEVRDAAGAAVYNLCVGGLHAYAVGLPGVLCHNAGPEGCGLGEAADGAKKAAAADEAAHQAAKPPVVPPAKPAHVDAGTPGTQGKLPPAQSDPPLLGVSDTLKKYADEVSQNLHDKKIPIGKTVVCEVVRDGSKFRGRAGFETVRELEGIALPEFIEVWRRQQAVAQGGYVGLCAEYAAIAKALAGHPEVNSWEKAVIFFKGATCQSAYAFKKAGRLEQGKFKEACSYTCNELLRKLGITELFAL